MNQQLLTKYIYKNKIEDSKKNQAILICSKNYIIFLFI